MEAESGAPASEPVDPSTWRPRVPPNAIDANPDETPAQAHIRHSRHAGLCVLVPSIFSVVSLIAFAFLLLVKWEALENLN